MSILCYWHFAFWVWFQHDWELVDSLECLAKINPIWDQSDLRPNHLLILILRALRRLSRRPLFGSPLPESGLSHRHLLRCHLLLLQWLIRLMWMLRMRMRRRMMIKQMSLNPFRMLLLWCLVNVNRTKSCFLACIIDIFTCHSCVIKLTFESGHQLVLVDNWVTNELVLFPHTNHKTVVKNLIPRYG